MVSTALYQTTTLMVAQSSALRQFLVVLQVLRHVQQLVQGTKVTFRISLLE